MNRGKGRGYKYSHHPCHRLSVPSANLFWCRHCMQIFEDPIARWKHSRSCKAVSSHKNQQDTHDIKNLFVGTHHILLPQKEKTLKKPVSVCVAPGKNPDEDLSCFICSKKFCSLEEMRNHVKFPCCKLPWKSHDYSDKFLDITDTSISDDCSVDNITSPLPCPAVETEPKKTCKGTVIEKDGPYTVCVDNVGSVTVSLDSDSKNNTKTATSAHDIVPATSDTAEDADEDAKSRDRRGRFQKGRKPSTEFKNSDSYVSDINMTSDLSSSNQVEATEQTKIPLKKRKCAYCCVEFSTEQALIKHNRYPCLLRQTRNLSQRVLRSKSKSTLPPISVDNKKKSPAKRVNRSLSSSISVPSLKTPHLVLTKKGKKLLREKRKLLIELKSRTVEKHKKMPSPSLFSDNMNDKEKFFFSLGMVDVNCLPPGFSPLDRQEEEKEIDELLNKYSFLGVLKPVSVDINVDPRPTVDHRTEEDDDCFPSPPILERIDVLKQSGIATEYSDEEDDDPPDLEIIPGVHPQGSNGENILSTLWEDFGLKSEKKSETAAPQVVGETENDSQKQSEETCFTKKSRFSIISPLKNRHFNLTTPLKDLKERHFTDLFLYGLGAFAFDIDKNIDDENSKETPESDESPNKLDKYGLNYIEKAIGNVKDHSVFDSCRYRAKERVKLPNLDEQFEKPSTFMEWRKSLFESFSEWCHAAKSCNKIPTCKSEKNTAGGGECSILEPSIVHGTSTVASSAEELIFTEASSVMDVNSSWPLTMSSNSYNESSVMSSEYQNYAPVMQDASQVHNIDISLSDCFSLVSSTADIQPVNLNAPSHQEAVTVSSTLLDSSFTDLESTDVATMEESNLLLHCVDETASDFDDTNDDVTYIIVKKNKPNDASLITNPQCEDRLTLHASEGKCTAQQNLLAQLADSKHDAERSVFHYVFQNQMGTTEAINPTEMANIILSHEVKLTSSSFCMEDVGRLIEMTVLPNTQENPIKIRWVIPEESPSSCSTWTVYYHLITTEVEITPKE